MFTVDIHARLIAAFLGDDEPCYGQCQCVPCRTSPLNGRPAGLSSSGAPATPNQRATSPVPGFQGD